MLNDLSFALRTLIARPAFAAAAVLTLAVGLGATTAIFSAVNAALLRPLPYPDAGNIYTLNTALTDGRFSAGLVAMNEMAELNESAPSVAKTALMVRSDTTLSTGGLDQIQSAADGGSSIPVVSYRVTDGFFDLFGVPLALGPGFTPDDFLPTGLSRNAIISDRVWRDWLGEDPDIVGKTLYYGTVRFHVVGVAAPDFDMPPGTDVWTAFPNAPWTPGAHVFNGYLRAQSGTTRERLTAELAGAMASLTEKSPASASGRAYVIHPLVESIVGDLGPVLILVLGAAALLLLLACVNVTNLLLGLSAARSREIAVRTALGAARSRIVRQLVTESLLLASLGTAAGFGLAMAGLRLLEYFGAATLPRLQDIPFDGTVVIFALTMLLFTVILIGLAPAIRLTRVDVRSLLNESGRTATGGRSLRRVLSGMVVAEIAVAITLVAGAGWLVRSFSNLSHTHPGFAAEGRLVFDVTLPGQYYGGAVVNWSARLADQLSAIGSVTAVGATSTVPLGPDKDAAFYIGTNFQSDDPDHLPTARQRTVSAGFFRAMGIRLLAGREFTVDDGEGNGDAIVNSTFVRTLLQDRDPATEPFFFGFPTVDRRRPYRIVGVVDDVSYGALGKPAEPTFYTPLTRRLQTVVVASSLPDPTSIIANVRDAVNVIEPTMSVQPVPMSTIVSASLAPQRAGMMLMTLFAVSALALAAIGIYGVTAYASAERLGEMATRMALGATPSDMFWMIMRQGRTLAAAGTVSGLLMASATGRVVSSQLYAVRALDPVVLLTAAALVLAIAIVAIAFPAQRASRADLAETLRT